MIEFTVKNAYGESGSVRIKEEVLGNVECKCEHNIVKHVSNMSYYDGFPSSYIGK